MGEVSQTCPGSSLFLSCPLTGAWPSSHRIRRSQSGSPAQVHDPELGDFKRGGFRSTAGPRLARPANTRSAPPHANVNTGAFLCQPLRNMSPLHLVRNLKTPFAKWSAEQVCEWLEEIGLGQYVVIARHWVASGQTLLSATPQDLERVGFCERPPG